MTLIANGTELTNSSVIYANNTEITAVYVNGVKVWEKILDFAMSLFYGGYQSDSTQVNTVTRISSTGTLVGSESNIGTARRYLAGASV